MCTFFRQNQWKGENDIENVSWSNLHERKLLTRHAANWATEAGPLSHYTVSDGTSPSSSSNEYHKKQKWQYVSFACIFISWPTQIALDKAYFFYQNVFFFSYFYMTCCGYSLEAPHRGASNEYPQHMFSWRNKKSIYLMLALIQSYTLVKNGSLCSSYICKCDDCQCTHIYHLSSSVYSCKLQLQIKWAGKWENVPSDIWDSMKHPHNLIKVFTVCMKKLWAFGYPKCSQWRVYSDCMKEYTHKFPWRNKNKQTRHVKKAKKKTVLIILYAILIPLPSYKDKHKPKQIDGLMNEWMDKCEQYIPHTQTNYTIN